ncbi:MAG: FkbM family methyltransferase [Blastochloris sp.]|nr:FkbM family methyltransferase [Blastochloris sp.]
MSNFCKNPTGICLEVGAYDGITGSATYVFEQRGWVAILVEPLPEMASSIRKHRKGPFFPIAAGPTQGTVTLHRSLEDPAISSTGENSWQSELYTIRQETTEDLEVEMRTLDWILEQASVSEIHFATIDVEGQEWAVLQGLDLKRWKPRVLLVEDNSRGLDSKVRNYLQAQDYLCFHHSGVNDWYAHRDDKDLVHLSSLTRMQAWRLWRQLRHAIKGCLPSFLKSMLRKLKIAGE